MGEHHASIIRKDETKKQVSFTQVMLWWDTPISLHFHVLQLVKSLPFNIHEAYKSHRFWAEPPHTGHCREYTTGVL